MGNQTLTGTETLALKHFQDFEANVPGVVKGPKLIESAITICRAVPRLLAENERQATRDAKLRAAICKAGFGIMETSGEWMVTCTTEAAKEAEKVEIQLISENIDLTAENERQAKRITELERANLQGHANAAWEAASLADENLRARIADLESGTLLAHAKDRESALLSELAGLRAELARLRMGERT